MTDNRPPLTVEGMQEILCILVAFQNGEKVFVPQHEYVTNPTPGSCVIREGGRPR